MSSGSMPAVRIARSAGHRGHRRGRLVGGRDPPLADPGAATDPLVGRVDHLLEVVVRQDLRPARSGPSR